MLKNEFQPFDYKDFLGRLTHRPGVYRMIGKKQELLYVGKAKDLKKRVASYFRNQLPNQRIRSMVSQIQSMEYTVTNTEAEALLLEINLIKAHKPRYNVLLRDDKSYPYIFISTEDNYPRIGFHRGAKKPLGRYFGPYPSAQSVRDTLNTLQRLFRIRQCEDSYFSNRSRPCLQYQIDRCTAPCVGCISSQDYRSDIEHAIRFLEGDSGQLIQELIDEMEKASSDLNYEKAARYRDQIKTLRQISEQQYISSNNAGNLDLVALARDGDTICVQIFTIRGGHNLGNKAWFPRVPGDLEAGEIMQQFLGQYYFHRDIPAEIIVTHPPDDKSTLIEALSDQARKRVNITSSVRGYRARLLALAEHNAVQALSAKNAVKGNVVRRFAALKDILGLENLPKRIECFDISHTQGEATVASCVIFGEQGAIKSDYRRFNIENITPGDDYAAMHQALERRFSRVKANDEFLPDILLIDGGKGQVHEAEQVLDALEINGLRDLLIIGITKGEGRRPEFDTLTSSRYETTIKLPSYHPALHLLQEIRDEAHRFAVMGHRQRREKSRRTSPLQSIVGMGPKRRRQVLMYFGGMRGVSSAGVDELTKVPGISRHLAEKIYEYFHGDGR